MPPVVHVAGTNGKGSVIAFLRAIVEAAGYRTHVAISPHLVRFNERIRVAGEIISDEALVAVLEECEHVNGGDPITFFEITTVAALLAFSRTPADICLLETGLGGRLDATNVIKKPMLTAITPVSMDHQAYLGDTLEEILREKAGILKSGVPCVAAAQERKATRLLDRHCKDAGAPLFREGREWQVRQVKDEKKDGMLVLTDQGGESKTRRLPAPGLVGRHQFHNAGHAVACVDHLAGFMVTDSAIALGLKTVDWPARLQRLARGPLVDRLPEGWELWLDGGHNRAAAKTLAAQYRQWRDRPLHLIVGMLNNRDPVDFLQPLEGKLARVRTLAIPGEANAHDAETLAHAARTLRLDAEPATGLAAALDGITVDNDRPARVLICGSLYLAGVVLTENG